MENERLLISLIIPTYKQEAFVGEAIRAAFQQTYSPLEIIISDDASPDGTYDVIQQEVSKYNGPHKIIARRNPKNLGLGAHINLLASMAQGELIVGAAGDDVSLPERAQRIYDAYQRSGKQAYCFYSNGYSIDETGRRLALLRSHPPSDASLTLEWLAEHRAGIAGCTEAWHRNVFDIFGPMSEQVVHEDYVIPFRAAILGSVEYLYEPLVLYRSHSGNLHFDADHKGKPDAKKMLSRIPGHVADYAAVYRTRLKDLDLAKRLFPARAEQFEALRAVTQRMLWEVETEGRLLEAPALRKAALFFQAMLKGTPPRRIARWITTYFFPSAYMAYMGWAGKSNRKKL